MSLPQWVQTQNGAFKRWCNMQYEQAGLPHIDDVVKDFSNGVRLLELLEIIGHESMGKYHRTPNHLQKYENLNIALDYIKHQGVQINSIGASDIAEGNLKLILGLIWVIILKYTISGISEEGLTAKEGLLLWCKRKTSGYDGIEVKDFSKSWSSGLALCALLHHFRPDLIDVDKLDPEKPLENIELALSLVQEKVGIPRIVEAEDVYRCRDEKSLVTYLAEWFHTFSDLDNVESAGRRIEQFCVISSLAQKMKQEYERKMRDLKISITSALEKWKQLDLGDLKKVKEAHSGLLEFKNTTKRNWVGERSDLGELYTNIGIKLETYGFKAYKPPHGLSLEDLAELWHKLVAAEVDYSRRVNKALGKFKEEARADFAKLANSLAESLESLSLSLSNVSGELEKQLEGTIKTSEQLVPLADSLGQLQEVNERCTDLGVEENDRTTYTYDELEFELECAKQLIANKLALVENHFITRSMTNVTPALLAEFESAFRQFDKTNRNTLQEHEFAAALASFGHCYSAEKMSEIFQSVANSDGLVSFHNFIVFLVSVVEDRQSLDQVKRAFLDISGDKDYVTREDLESALLPEYTIDLLVDAMPHKRDGYDFHAYLNSVCPASEG